MINTATSKNLFPITDSKIGLGIIRLSIDFGHRNGNQFLATGGGLFLALEDDHS
jgi:hypothetical protein